MVQQSLFRAEAKSQDPASMATEKNGVVYTKPWVVELILDLVGYSSSTPLYERLFVEPSAGDGAFLVAVVQRLVESLRAHGRPLAEGARSLIAFEIDEAAAQAARASIERVLLNLGASKGDADLLAHSWVRCDDFLLESSAHVGRADWVVGNPPYIRLEDLPNGGTEYRQAFPTMVGRADIYIAFYEAAVRLLKPGGLCGFICADRWMFNQYGSALRRYITSVGAVEAVLQMHRADAFEAQVDAYPAISIIRRGEQGPAVVSSLDAEAERAGGARLAREILAVLATGEPAGCRGLSAARVDTWFKGDEPWPLLSPGKFALLRRLERDFSTLEATGANVGIGVASGADKVFITKDETLVERERLLPLAMASDLKGTQTCWSRRYLVNPWEGTKLVELAHYPKLRDYLESHRTLLAARHVGKRDGDAWYRTIDRVNHALVAQTKLYFPDIKGRIAPALDRGNTYPHHNLYFVSTSAWDAEVLGGLLLSNVAQFFVEAYGVRMRGGCLRFQAQYLRRIRVPSPSSLSLEEADALRRAFASNDVRAASQVAARIYRLSPLEADLLDA